MSILDSASPAAARPVPTPSTASTPAAARAPLPAGGAGVLDVVHGADLLDELRQAQYLLADRVAHAGASPDGVALATLQSQRQQLAVLPQTTATLAQVPGDDLNHVIGKTI